MNFLVKAKRYPVERKSSRRSSAIVKDVDGIEHFIIQQCTNI